MIKNKITHNKVNTENIAWNKRYINNKQNKYSLIILFLFLIIVAITSLYYIVFTTKKIQQEPIVLESVETQRQKAWLKEKLNLANLPFDENYVDFNELNKQKPDSLKKDDESFPETIPAKMLKQLDSQSN